MGNKDNYRIIESRGDKGKILYTVQKNRKWIIPWKWHNCKLEIFCGPGTIVYPAIFTSKEQAKLYIKHKGSMVNGLIPGFYHYIK
jgi:hypothetical protein